MTSVWLGSTHRVDALMCTRLVGLHDAPNAKVLSHLHYQCTMTREMPGRLHFELVRDRDKRRRLVINSARRGPSSSVSAVNFNPSPLPGFTCRITASALICPS